MKEQDFFNITPGRTIVICKERAPDMEAGWSDELDSMVNIPLVVDSLSGKFIRLRHPNSGTRYSFDYQVLSLYHKKKVVDVISWRDQKLLLFGPVTLDSLMVCTLNSDFERLMKLLQIGLRDEFKITSEFLNKVQDACPRIIGVLLSNNFMKKS